mgnify:CR=1 FL=1
MVSVADDGARPDARPTVTDRGSRARPSALRYGFFATILGVTGVVLSVLGFLAVRNPAAARLVASSDGVASLLTGLSFTAIACALVAALRPALGAALGRISRAASRDVAAGAQRGRAPRERALHARDAGRHRRSDRACSTPTASSSAVNRAWRARLHPPARGHGRVRRRLELTYRYCDGVRGERASRGWRAWRRRCRAITAGEHARECLLSRASCPTTAQRARDASRASRAAGPAPTVVAHQDVKRPAWRQRRERVDRGGGRRGAPEPARSCTRFGGQLAAPVDDRAGRSLRRDRGGRAAGRVPRPDAAGPADGHANARFLARSGRPRPPRHRARRRVARDGARGRRRQPRSRSGSCIVDGGGGGEAAFPDGRRRRRGPRRAGDADGRNAWDRLAELAGRPRRGRRWTLSAAARADAAARPRARRLFGTRSASKRTALSPRRTAAGASRSANAAAAAFCGATPAGLVGPRRRAASRRTARRPTARSSASRPRRAGPSSAFEVARRFDRARARLARGELTLAVAVDVTERHAAGSGTIRALESESSGGGSRRAHARARPADPRAAQVAARHRRARPTSRW